MRCFFFILLFHIFKNCLTLKSKHLLIWQYFHSFLMVNWFLLLIFLEVVNHFKFDELNKQISISSIEYLIFMVLISFLCNSMICTIGWNCKGRKLNSGPIAKWIKNQLSNHLINNNFKAIFLFYWGKNSFRLNLHSCWIKHVRVRFSEKVIPN